MAASPVFAATQRVALAQVSTANTNRDGTGTLASVIAGGASGTVINSIRIIATGTTTAGVVRLFLHDGTNTRLFREVLVPAITPSTTVEAFSRLVTFALPDVLMLPSTNWEIRASTHNAEVFNIIVQGADL